MVRLRKQLEAGATAPAQELKVDDVRPGAVGRDLLQSRSAPQATRERPFRDALPGDVRRLGKVPGRSATPAMRTDSAHDVVMSVICYALFWRTTRSTSQSRTWSSARSWSMDLR